MLCKNVPLTEIVSKIYHTAEENNKMSTTAKIAIWAKRDNKETLQFNCQ